MSRRATTTDRDHGFTSIFVALILTALLIITAIAIDGSFSYAQRRTMQNAADAGSMAGGQAMYKAQAAGLLTIDPNLVGSPWPTTTSCSADLGTYTTDVYLAAYCTAIVKDGGSFPTDGEDFCDVIDSSGNTLGKCYNSTLGSPETAVLSKVNGSYTAVGVKLVTENSRTTFFGQFAGRSTAVVRTRAAASIQPIGGTSAPWVICGATQNSGYDFLVDSGNSDETSSDTGTDADDALKPEATLLATFEYGGTNKGVSTSDANATLLMQVASPQGNTKCGSHSSSADGRGDGTVTGNGQATVKTGNGTKVTNNNSATPVGNCWSTTVGSAPNEPCTPCPTGTFDPKSSIGASGCDLILPIVDWGADSGSKANFHVVTEAVFHVENVSSHGEKIAGWLDDPSGFHVTQTFTQSGSCSPGAAVCVVKLIDFPSNGLLE